MMYQNSVYTKSFQICISSFDLVLQDLRASLMAQMVKNLPATQDTRDRSLGQEDALEKATATHSSIHARRFPWMEEPGKLQSMGLQGRT